MSELTQTIILKLTKVIIETGRSAITSLVQTAFKNLLKYTKKFFGPYNSEGIFNISL